MWMIMEHWWSGGDRGKQEVLGGKKPVSVPLGPPQMSHGLGWDRTRASAAKGPVPKDWI